MNKEYAIYPFRYMNVTQRHDQGNHISHWKNVTNWIDLPWDEGCKDGGKSYFEPRNDFVIEQVLGLDSTGDRTTNSVRLKSVNKLYMPYKTEPDYLYLTLTHMNEDNLKQVKQGQVLKAGTKILMEGTDGWSTGNHFHITANLGKYYGLLENNQGAWCFTYEKSLLPNEAFYLDGNYTNVVYAREYAFQPVPKAEPVGTIVERNEEVDQIEVKVPQLYCREKPNKSGKILGFTKQGIHNYTDKSNADGYDWYNIGVGWIAYTDEWCNLYPKKEIQENNTPSEPLKAPNNDENTENSPIIPADTKNTENDTNNAESGVNSNKEENIFIKLIKMLVNLLKKIVKG